MGRYNQGYDVFGEPLSVLPKRRIKSGVSDGEVMARIEREIHDVCALEDAVGAEEERPAAATGGDDVA